MLIAMWWFHRTEKTFLAYGMYFTVTRYSRAECHLVMRADTVLSTRARIQIHSNELLRTTRGTPPCFWQMLLQAHIPACPLRGRMNGGRP